MTRKTTPTLQAFVRIFSETGSYSATARRLKLGSRATVYRWLEASSAAEEAEDTSSEFFFQYEGVEDYLHNHARMTLDAAVEDVEAGLIRMASEGYYRKAMYHGQTVYKLDPALIGMDDETFKMLGYEERDRYLKDENGNLVPEMEHIAPTVERQLAVLAAHSEKWKKHSRVDVNTSVQGGVMVVHGIGQQAQKALPPQQEKPLPMIEVLPDAVLEQVVEDAEAEEIAQPVEIEEPEQMAPAPAPVTRVSPEARKATNPGAAELLRWASLSPEERAAEAARRVRVR